MEEQYLGNYFKRVRPEDEPIEPDTIQMFQQGNALTFIVLDEKDSEEREDLKKTKAFLTCEVDDIHKFLIARGIEVQERFRNKHEFNFGTQLFLRAIGYAREKGYKVVTDSSVSEDADKLIQFLISQGFKFVKNSQVEEKVTVLGITYKTTDDSPVYILED